MDIKTWDRLSAIFLLSGLTLLPHLAYAKYITLTCPNSRKGSPQIQLTLTAEGGFTPMANATTLSSLRASAGLAMTNVVVY